MGERFRVILAVESSRAYGRGCLRGVAAYARAHGPWTFLHTERGLTERLPRQLAKWRGDGVIARIETPQMARAIHQLDLPAVDLRGRRLLSDVTSIDTDPLATAQLAADHFLQRGFRSLAYCGLPGVDFSDQRCRAFRSYLADKHIAVHVHEPRVGRRHSDDTLMQESRGSMGYADIASWLRELPKPVGIMACNDVRGRHVLDACRDCLLRVPEDVAVVGVDDDHVICELCDPPLSSVEPDLKQIGYRGAEVLHAMLLGRTSRPRIVHVPPRRVVTRLSSDTLAIEDTLVAEAVHLIRQHAAGPFNVENLLDRMTTVSRATLDRRFIAALRRTPKQEILRIRLARVSQLLAETGYSLSRIAEMTGFASAAHLSIAFKSQFGSTPGSARILRN